MKLTIERDALLAALNHVQGAVERKTLIPILSAFLLEAADDAVSITGTNLDVEARASAVAEISERGVIAVPADVFAGFIKKLPPKMPVSLVHDKDASAAGNLKIACGRARLSIPLIPAADFPTVPTSSEGAVSFSLGAPELSRLLAQTRFACSNEETRYYLCGVYVHVRATDDGDRLAFVATDGHRMAYADTDPPACDKGFAAIIPRHTAALIAKLIEGDLGDVELELSKAHVSVTAAAGVLRSKLIDGNFPDYQRIIPRGNPHRMTLPRANLSDALGRLLIVADERSRSVRMTASADLCAMRALNPERGEASEDISAAYDGDDIEIGFNAKLLAEALTQSGAEEVRIELADAGAPAVLRAPDDASAFSVLMPLRV